MPTYNYKGRVPVRALTYKVADFDDDEQDELLIVDMNDDYEAIFMMYELNDDNEVELRSSILDFNFGAITDTFKFGLWAENGNFATYLFRDNSETYICAEESV
ncbi:hypothetical protein QYZ88_008095 [Lachnospiraceae bacterium C1.1]|nr:hypothetical protein [Lachnospiraceae bacterium C1.1]